MNGRGERVQKTVVSWTLRRMRPRRCAGTRQGRRVQAEVGRKGRERNRGASRFLPHFRLLRVKSQRASRKQKTTGAFTGRIRYSGAAEAKTGGSDQALSQVAERAEAITPGCWPRTNWTAT